MIPIHNPNFFFQENTYTENSELCAQLQRDPHFSLDLGKNSYLI